MFWKRTEKTPPKKEQFDPRKKVEITPVVLETPIQRYQQTMEIRRQGILSILERLKGHKLTPSEFIHLVTDAFPKFRERESSEVAPRKEEARQAYLFIDYLHSIATKRVRLIPFGVVTANILNAIGFIGDKVSKPEIYDRDKELWWGRIVNRPDRNELHEIKDRTLNSSYVSYVELYKLTDESRDTPDGLDAKNMFMTGMMYEQLRHLVHHRREKVNQTPEGKELTLPFAAIAAKDSYTITLHRAMYSKKVSIPARLIEEGNFRQFHLEMYQAMTSREGWVNTTKGKARELIKTSSARGYSGTENIAQAKKKDVQISVILLHLI